jgi:hypothetical protein
MIDVLPMLPWLLWGPASSLRSSPFAESFLPAAFAAPLFRQDG